MEPVHSPYTHGLVQGSLAAAQGGSFRAGMLSGAVSSMGGSLQSRLGLDSHPLSSTIAVALVSGTASEIGGGKFANGALSGAIIHVFNSLGGTEAQERVRVIVFYDGEDVGGDAPGFLNWRADGDDNRAMADRYFKGAKIYDVGSMGYSKVLEILEKNSEIYDMMVFIDHGGRGFQTIGNDPLGVPRLRKLGSYLNENGVFKFMGCGVASDHTIFQTISNFVNRSMEGFSGNPRRRLLGRFVFPPVIRVRPTEDLSHIEY